MAVGKNITWKKGKWEGKQDHLPCNIIALGIISSGEGDEYFGKKNQDLKNNRVWSGRISSCRQLYTTGRWVGVVLLFLILVSGNAKCRSISTLILPIRSKSLTFETKNNVMYVNTQAREAPYGTIRTTYTKESGIPVIYVKLLPLRSTVLKSTRSPTKD